jgi:hypothetical protein
MNNGFMGNSAIPPYLKAIAAAMLAVTYLAALSDAVYQYIFHPTAALPTDVTFILGTGLGIALQIIGAHTGASLSTETVHQASSQSAAPAPVTPDPIAAPAVTPAPVAVPDASAPSSGA